MTVQVTAWFSRGVDVAGRRARAADRDRVEVRAVGGDPEASRARACTSCRRVAWLRAAVRRRRRRCRLTADGEVAPAGPRRRRCSITVVVTVSVWRDVLERADVARGALGARDAALIRRRDSRCRRSPRALVAGRARGVSVGPPYVRRDAPSSSADALDVRRRRSATQLPSRDEVVMRAARRRRRCCRRTPRPAFVGEDRVRERRRSRRLATHARRRPAMPRCSATVTFARLSVLAARRRSPPPRAATARSDVAWRCCRVTVDVGRQSCPRSVARGRSPPSMIVDARVREP